MAAFTLAHLSDPHLPPLPVPRLSELLGKRALGYLNWTRNRHQYHRRDVLDVLVSDMQAQVPDQIAVTGDLVNLALEAEFAPALNWLRSVGPPERVTAVPGNHDAYVRATQHRFEESFADYLRGDEASDATFPLLRRRGPLVLIGLSTAVPTPPFMATGRLGARQIARMTALLEGAAAQFRVVLIHHPPVVPKSHFKRLVDAAAFRQAIAEAGAELVIHGHDHVRSLDFIDGPRGRVPVIGVPSASAAFGADHDAAGYNLYRIDGRPGGWTCEVERRGLNAAGAVVECERFAM
jgi:3',5'-cyclic AMP phosphodiesterase CpdA